MCLLSISERSFGLGGAVMRESSGQKCKKTENGLHIVHVQL